MTEHPGSARPNRASARFAALVGLPVPEPLTETELAAYRAWMDDAERRQAELLARRTSSAA